MRMVDIENIWKYGVYFWCFICLLSSLPFGVTITILLVTFSSAYFIYISSRASPNTQDKKSNNVFTAAWSVAYGLVLYAATRIIFRQWSPGVIVGSLFGVAQAISLAVTAMETWEFDISRYLYHLFRPLSTIPTNLRLVLGRIENRSIRVTLQAVVMTVWVLGMIVFTTMNVFIQITSEEFPSTRKRVWHWRRKQRTYPLPSTGSPYEYQPLRGNAPETSKIRILKLLRRWPFGPIRCELMTVDLHSDVEYECISYHWGKATFTEIIYIDGKPFKVSPIVEEMLYHLSSYLHERLLWIDAVCINQSDRDEKNHQITLMRDVYHDASHVIIWLDGVKEASMARRMLAGIVHEHMHGTTESLYEMMRQNSEPFVDSGWKQLMNVFADPWFSRIWVIQELVNARQATFLASGVPLKLANIAVFVQLINLPPFNMIVLRGTNPGVEEEAIRGLTNTSLMIRLLQSRDAPQAGLGTLLGVLSEFRATEDVDRIYGILGLLPVEEADQEHLRPNSSKTAEMLFKDVAQHLMSTEPQDVLSYAGTGYTRKLVNLPSWATDWTSVSMGDTRRMHFAKIQHAARFTSGAGLPLTGTFLADPAQPERVFLTILGHVLDVVAHVSLEMTYTPHNAGQGGTNEELDAVDRSHMSARELVMNHAREPYPTGQTLEEVFWRSLIADTQFERPAPEQLGRGCLEWERMTGLDKDQLHNVANDEALRMALEWNSARIMAATGRAVAVTTDGYVAVVPPGTEVGDLVCVFFGINTPFVVRPQALDQMGGVEEVQLKRLVGEAYVHGMMDGEAQRLPNWIPEAFAIF